MGFMRFAGDVFRSGSGKKSAATMGTINSGGSLLGTVRAIGSQFHPLAGAVDDIVSVGEKTNATNNSGGIKEWGENLVGTIGSGLSAIGSVGGLLGVKGAAAANPVGATIGLSTLIAKPAVEGMSDPVRRKADADMYKKMMGR
jgi:hypothetical protein